jgi:hypothetical protein
MSVLFSCFCLFMIGCASQGGKTVSDPSGQQADDSPPAPQDAAAGKLAECLQKNGYQGVGLRYESVATIDLLSKVFADSRTAGRQINLVYTGMGMSYDPAYKSLTVGGTSDAEAVIGFIDKNIPLKPSK